MITDRIKSNRPALANLMTARAALEAAATQLERQYGKGSPEAEAVLGLFDSVCELAPVR